MSEPNPYQPPVEESELQRPTITPLPPQETPTYAQEALYFAGVAGVVFLLTLGFVVSVQVLPAIFF